MQAIQDEKTETEQRPLTELKQLLQFDGIANSIDSFVLMRKHLELLLSVFTYQRNIFPKSEYRIYEAVGQKIPVFFESETNSELRRFLFLFSQIFDAVRRGYLDEVKIMFCSNKEPVEAFEEFSYKFQYDSDGNLITCNDEKKLTVQIMEEILKIFHRTQCVSEKLRPLPKSGLVYFCLKYKNETPPNYNPKHFRSCQKEHCPQLKNGKKINLGNLTTPYHQGRAILHTPASNIMNDAQPSTSQSCGDEIGEESGGPPPGIQSASGGATETANQPIVTFVPEERTDDVSKKEDPRFGAFPIQDVNNGSTDHEQKEQEHVQYNVDLNEGSDECDELLNISQVIEDFLRDEATPKRASRNKTTMNYRKFFVGKEKSKKRKIMKKKIGPKESQNVGLPEDIQDENFPPSLQKQGSAERIETNIEIIFGSPFEVEQRPQPLRKIPFQERSMNRTNDQDLPNVSSGKRIGINILPVRYGLAS